MTATLTTIDRAGITLLVVPAQQLLAVDVSQDYPIDLAESTAEINDALHAVAWLNETTPNQLSIVGIKFADPEQHNTTVTLSGSDLGQVTWVLGDGWLTLSSAAGVLAAVDHLDSVTVPVYA